VLKPAWRARVTVEALRAFARTQLAPYKVPRLVELTETLPLTRQGKVLKRALRAG
jgi:long-chain acyl-CoA synthetase